MSDDPDLKPHRPALGQRLHLNAAEPGRRMSEILKSIATDSPQERITVADLLSAMEGRAFGALLLLFAFPNILPSPPGLAGILGLPLIYLASQLMLGRNPWLPNFIGNRSITRESFASLVTRAAPWIARAEKMLVERYVFLISPSAQRALGAVCLLLALILVLPIPFGNMLPSIAICVIALGILERDGLWIIGGLVAGFVATVVVGGLAYGLIKSALFVLMNAF